MTYDTTPRLSPTTSMESTDSLVTPNHSDTSTFVDDCADRHFLLFKNSSEVWEEFKDVGCDPFGIPVADAGIPISPSSSLSSGIDLLGDTLPPPLPEVTAVPVRSGSHQMAVPRRISVFDFPSPPVLVPAMGKSRLISGSPPVPIRHSQSSALQRWSTPPSTTFHPDKHTGTFQTRVEKRTVTWTDPPVPRLPSVNTPPSAPGPGGHDVPSPVRRSRRQEVEVSDAFTSFIDMSINEPTLSTSRVHRLFSKISGSLKPRSRYH